MLGAVGSVREKGGKEKEERKKEKRFPKKGKGFSLSGTVKEVKKFGEFEGDRKSVV